MHEEATQFRYKDSPLYWRFNCERQFLCASFLMDELLREHNERFFFLTAQNARICKDVWVSCIMFRLGQHERWNYIGMPTVICDAMAKLRVSPSGYNSSAQDSREGMIITTKRPSAGLDLIREYLDTMRSSYQCYITGWVQVEDGQRLVQLKRTTEGGLQTGYVLLVDNKIEKMPETELAMDCMLPEGPPDRFEIVNQLLNAIPRDGDYDSEMWTTVDKDKTNVRQKAKNKLVKGFSLYMVFMGKNFPYEGKTEARYMFSVLFCVD